MAEGRDKNAHRRQRQRYLLSDVRVAAQLSVASTDLARSAVSQVPRDFAGSTNKQLDLFKLLQHFRIYCHLHGRLRRNLLVKLRDNPDQQCVKGVGVLVFVWNLCTGDGMRGALQVGLIRGPIAATAKLDTGRGFGGGRDLLLAQNLERKGLRRGNGNARARARNLSRKRQCLVVTRIG